MQQTSEATVVQTVTPPARGADVQGAPVVSGVPAPMGVPAGNPTAVYRALREQREVLGNQLESLEDKREELVQDIQQSRGQGITIAGLEKRMAEIDVRTSTLDEQIAQADAAVARAAAIPGAVPPEPQHVRSGPPEEVFILGTIFMLLVAFPLTIAYARRVWKRGSAAVSALPSDLMDRLRGIEQAVEATALEVERIGEGQRFMSRVLTERPDAQAVAGAAQLGQGAAQPIDVAARERVTPGLAR